MQCVNVSYIEFKQPTLFARPVLNSKVQILNKFKSFRAELFTALATSGSVSRHTGCVL